MDVSDLDVGRGGGGREVEGEEQEYEREYPALIASGGMERRCLRALEIERILVICTILSHPTITAAPSSYPHLSLKNASHALDSLRPQLPRSPPLTASSLVSAHPPIP